MSAPMTRRFVSSTPFLTKAIVGMAETSNSCVTASSLSTSTSTNWMPGYFDISLCKSSFIARHGPHQDAVNSRTHGPSGTGILLQGRIKKHCPLTRSFFAKHVGPEKPAHRTFSSSVYLSSDCNFFVGLYDLLDLTGAYCISGKRVSIHRFQCIRVTRNGGLATARRVGTGTWHGALLNTL